MKGRKSAISVRIGSGDVRNVKAIAMRLGVRDSAVFRYAVRSSLEQLGPLVDPSVQGRHLLPVLVEAAPALLRYLDLDAARLVEIVNAGVQDPDGLVAPEDLTLLSMAGVQQSDARGTISTLLDETPSLSTEKEGLVDGLREYLYEKYVFRSARRFAVG